MSSSDTHTRNPQVSDLFVFLVVCPLLVAFAVVFGSGTPDDNPSVSEPSVVATADRGRLVVVIVDSLRPQLIADDDVMPALHAFSRRSDVTALNLETCRANFTLPCVQTMLEGRESPFVAGLHNFTGQAGSRISLPGVLAQAGYGVAMISDHTLDSLYADDAIYSFDVQTWKERDHLERDLGAFEKAHEQLRQDRVDVLLLHPVGTDKSAHLDRPGAEKYRRHFGAVDAALGSLLESLDLERDSVVIVGDHGHGELGHHDRHSVAVFAGAKYDALFGQLPQMEKIEQIDLYYFLAYPLGVPIPTSYEGHAFVPDSPAGPVAEYLKTVGDHFREAGVPPDLDVEEAIVHIRAEQRAQRFDPVLRYSPLLLLFALFVATALRALRVGPTRFDLQTLGVMSLAAIGIALVTSPAVGPWLCGLVALAGCWVAVRQGAWRAHAFIAGLAVVAALASAHASAWSGYFHTTGGFRPSLAVFYALFFVAGAPLAVLFFGRLRYLAYGAMAYAVYCIPSGPYYYQEGQNVLLAFFVGAIAVGLWWLVGRIRRDGVSAPQLPVAHWLVIGLCGLAAVFLVMQEAGGWEWRLHAVTWMGWAPPAVAWTILALLGTFWIWTCESRAARLVVAGFVSVSAVFCVVAAELGIGTFVGALLPAFFLLTLLEARKRLGAGANDTESLGLRQGLLVAGLTIVALWIACRGFMIQNVDFNFALDWFSEAFARERDVFAATYVVTLLKFGLPPAAVVVALRTHLGRTRFRPVVAGTLAYLLLEVLMLFVQIFAGSTTGAEKYHELAISQLLFIYSLAWIVATTFAVVRTVDRLTDDRST